MITPATADAAVITDFEITDITGGSLFQNDGTTQITNGEFITLAQAKAGLEFTPTSGDATFTVQESTTATANGVGGTSANASITVTGHAPSITTATTTALTQTTSGLVITPSPQDTGVADFEITGITDGSLFQNNGTTAIANGEFITAAQAAAGLRFTPTAGFTGIANFQVQEATGASTEDLLSGATATADVTVNFAGPSVTGATTPFDTQTTSGLVISTPATDTPSDFQITDILGGELFQNDGATQITDGQFITTAQGEAGLKFTPNSTGSGNFTVQESSNASTTGLSGPTTTATISVTIAAPTVTNATTTENTQTSSGLVITPSVSAATEFEITGITGGSLFENDGVTQIANGTFITVAEGEAGLKFTPTTGSLTSGSFTITQASGTSTSDVFGPTATATISVTLGGRR